MLEWARRILADVEWARRRAPRDARRASGRLRIGAIPTSLPSSSLLTTPLCARHPAVTVSISRSTRMQIERGLHDFELELGITYLDSEPLRGVRALPLRGALPAAHLGDRPPHAGDERDLGAGGESAAVPAHGGHAEPPHRRTASSREAGPTPRPTVETNSISTLYAHVRDGSWSSVSRTPGSTLRRSRAGCVRSRSSSPRRPGRSGSSGSTAIPSRCSRARSSTSRLELDLERGLAQSPSMMRSARPCRRSRGRRGRSRTA